MKQSESRIGIKTIFVFIIIHNLITEKMKASELTHLSDISMLTAYNHGQHYKHSMLAGRAFPTTKAQAQSFIREAGTFDVLCYRDVLKISEFMAKHGMEADFRLTKSRGFARLNNSSDFCACLRKEYSF